MAKGDLYKILKEEHTKIKGLLKQALQNKDTSKFPQIRKQLEVHMLGEEEFLYPLMEIAAQEMTLKAFQEHNLAWQILVELDNISIRDERWMPKLKVLNDVINHHIEQEEGNGGIFEKASKTLSEEAEEGIIKLYEEEKSEKSKGFSL